MSDTPILSKFLASKPGIWRDWTSRDFHELEGLASRFEKDRARLKEALSILLDAVVSLPSTQESRTAYNHAHTILKKIK